MKLPLIQDILMLPKPKQMRYCLQMQRWPVTWFDTKQELEDKRQKKIQSLYPAEKKV